MSTISVGRTCDYSEKGRLIICHLKEKEEKKQKKDNKQTVKILSVRFNKRNNNPDRTGRIKM